MTDAPIELLEETAKPLLEDPKFLFSLVNKFVSIEMIKNCSYSGFVHSIDPVSKSIILQVPKKDIFETMLILGHSILNILETTPTTDRRPSRKASPSLSEEGIIGRKKKVIAWLKKNLLPVTENKEIIDVGIVSILPPYSVKDLCTENPVVAVEIKKILENMPDDFQP